MSKKKLPVDAYSAEEFREKLGSLQRAGVDYVPPSSLRNQNEERQILHAAATDEERRMIIKLDQLYANAQKEATEEDEAMGSRKIADELLPRIETMRRDTEETLKQVGDDPPPVVASLGRAVIKEAEEAHRMTKTESSSRLGKIIIEIFMRIRELYRRFKEFVESFFTQDKFGKNKQ